MRRGALLVISAGILSLGACIPSSAQDAAANGQNPTPPATTTTTAPAGNKQPVSTEKKDSTTQAPAPKAKKVWTNDDMGDLHGNSDVSVVGKKKRPDPNDSYSPRPGQSEYMVMMYRRQIDQLQAQADAIDKEISNLQEAKNGKTVDSTRKYDPWGGKQGDWDSQITQLRKNKEYVQQQIDSVEEQIRKLNP